MARTIIVGESERKTSYCPQCRKPVLPGNKSEKGIKCSRCGFFKWSEFSKYPSFVNIPEPTDADRVATENLFKDAEEKKPAILSTPITAPPADTKKKTPKERKEASDKAKARGVGEPMPKKPYPANLPDKPNWENKEWERDKK